MSIDLTSAERAELDRLRRENHLLRVEKEMLLRIATEYALERHGRADLVDARGRSGSFPEPPPG
ncbi:hypothetical protein [Saccharopolyspora sp. ASAGF58]|uniref:hypothetical protein n=1 Tax=Saccharopolyspora sp. ASAGF58 TaxID=2719023 RepID=UPI0014401689|nr:hypothetical protein [Saccharopolyspora sp. ASAGF58]QIZ33637.1 hypothetical protein FDZ84_01440 [Saccharopolyspora sp. ASAGF58]